MPRELKLPNETMADFLVALHALKAQWDTKSARGTPGAWVMNKYTLRQIMVNGISAGRAHILTTEEKAAIALSPATEATLLGLPVRLVLTPEQEQQLYARIET